MRPTEDAARYVAGDRDHHAIAAMLSELKVSDPDFRLRPLHHELFFGTAHAGPNGELSMVVLKTRYGGRTEQGVRIIDLTASPTAGGLRFSVTRSTFVPRPEPRPEPSVAHLRTAPCSRNYRLAVKSTGDHKGA